MESSSLGVASEVVEAVPSVEAEEVLVAFPVAVDLALEVVAPVAVGNFRCSKLRIQNEKFKIESSQF
jgi:hypothetical protein